MKLSAHKDNIDKHEENRVSKARYVALNAIVSAHKNGLYARDALNRVLDMHVLSTSDRAFAAKLALGVTQTLGTLDDVIYRCVESPDDIKDNVMDCLRISTYEIIYLEKEPHAAVDQGVELVKYIEPRARGLANLVLRRVVKLKNDFPFGNVDEDEEAFARIYAIPKWECDLVFDSVGEKAARYLISSSNGQAPCYIFVNSLKSNRDEIVELFKSVDGKPVVIEGFCGVKLHGCIRIDKPATLQNAAIKEAIDAGKFSIADVASQSIVNAAIDSIDEAKSMLEFCAGKGSKTLMFQSLANLKWNKQLDLFAIDNVQEKLDILKKRANRAGVNVTSRLCCDASNWENLVSVLDNEFNNFIPKFDIVFVDAPCSGLGTLRRHPELKWRLTPKKIEELAETDIRVLYNASQFVAPGGMLNYSTCTVTNKENEDVCKKFLKSEQGKKFTLKKFSVDNKDYPFFRTLTFSGLNDCHFFANFKRID